MQLWSLLSPFSLYFCISVFQSFSPSVFKYYCLFVMVSSSDFISSSFQFILVHWNSPGCPLSPFQCFFVFSYNCLSVIVSFCLRSFFQFMSFHISSLQFAWKTSESFSLYFHIFVFLSFCLSLLLSFCHCDFLSELVLVHL